MIEIPGLKAGTRGLLLLIASVVAIALMTLWPIPGGRGFAEICIICGERGASDFLSNIILFAPLGVALSLRGRSLLSAILIGVSYSLAIELTQIEFVTGRDASLGDLISNSLGTIVGWSVGSSREWWRRGEGGLLKALSVTVATLAILLGGLALLTPVLPDATYFLQWTMRFRGMSVYRGEVHATRIGAMELNAPGPIEETDSVRRMLFSEPIEFTATAGPAPRSLAPIISIYDQEQREIMLLGANGTDLIYRYRVLADALRLDRADILVPRVFQTLLPGESFALKWEADGRGYCLEMAGESQCGPGFTVGDTWTLVKSISLAGGERRLIHTVWLWLFFLPAGFVSGGRSRTILASMTLTITALVAFPAILGFATTPVYQLVAAGMGVLTGSLAARAMRHRRKRHIPAMSSNAGI